MKADESLILSDERPHGSPISVCRSALNEWPGNLAPTDDQSQPIECLEEHFWLSTSQRDV